MIERKKDRFLGERNLSFLFVGPPGDCVVGSGLFENAMCVEVKRLIFDKIALRKKTRFREVSPVLNKLVRRRLQEGQKFAIC